MPAGYKLTPFQRCLNHAVKVWVWLGLPPRKYHLLTAPGRRTGRLHTTPVSVLEAEGARWLVCPYGERAWVKNVRAAGEVRLSRGRRAQRLAVAEEPDAYRRASLLRAYVLGEPITRKHFRAAAHAPLEEFVAEADAHPVFRLLEPDSQAAKPG